MANLSIDKIYELKNFKMMGCEFSFGERSTNETRHCCRCGIALDDPASWERGIGPICAQKSTAIFSKTIPVDIGEIQTRIITIDALMGDLPQELHSNVKNMFKFVELVSDKVKEGVGIDWRPIVRVIDYCCSYAMNSSLKNNFISLVRAMGFPALAAVLSGEASTGEAKLSFNEANGRIELRGSSCKSGARAIWRLGGCTTPRYRGSKEPFTAPASKAKEFLNIVEIYWPLFEGATDEILEKAEQRVEADKAKKLAEMQALAGSNVINTLAQNIGVPVVEQRESELTEEMVSGTVGANNPALGNAVIRIRREDIVLTFPFDNNAQKMIAELKKVHYSERSYYDRAWFFMMKHRPMIEGIVKKYYNLSFEMGTDESPASYGVVNRHWSNTKR